MLRFHCCVLAAAKNSKCSILSISEFWCRVCWCSPGSANVKPRRKASLYKELCLFSLETGTLGVTPRMTEASGQAQSDLQLTLPEESLSADVFFRSCQPAQRARSFRRGSGNENKRNFASCSPLGRARPSEMTAELLKSHHHCADITCLAPCGLSSGAETPRWVEGKHLGVPISSQEKQHAWRWGKKAPAPLSASSCSFLLVNTPFPNICFPQSNVHGLFLKCSELWSFLSPG